MLHNDIYETSQRALPMLTLSNASVFSLIWPYVKNKYEYSFFVLAWFSVGTYTGACCQGGKGRQPQKAQDRRIIWKFL